MRPISRDPGPMNCDAVARFLQQYLDEELDVPRAKRLAEHLSGCSWCGADADAFRQVKAALAHSADTRDADDDATERLREFGQGLLRGDPPASG